MVSTPLVRSTPDLSRIGPVQITRFPFGSRRERCSAPSCRFRRWRLQTSGSSLCRAGPRSKPSERDVVSRGAELSADGHYVLRLDYPGVGHSSGAPQIFDLESPPIWAMEAACRFLVEETPVERVILAGSCFGARVALRAARGLDRVVSVAMVAGPVYARRPSLARRLGSIPRRVLGLGRWIERPTTRLNSGGRATSLRSAG